MIVHDFECQVCGNISEVFMTRPFNQGVCPDCGGEARKVFTPRRQAAIDAPWIASVCEIVDKSPNKPHCQEFLRHPTRANYHKWMKGEGLRPMEPGEGPPRPEPREARLDRIKHDMKMRFRERNALSI